VGPAQTFNGVEEQMARTSFARTALCTAAAAAGLSLGACNMAHPMTPAWANSDSPGFLASSHYCGDPWKADPHVCESPVISQGLVSQN
jgi:hypothetical protein